MLSSWSFVCVSVFPPCALFFMFINQPPIDTGNKGKLRTLRGIKGNTKTEEGNVGMALGHHTPHGLFFPSPSTLLFSFSFFFSFLIRLSIHNNNLLQQQKPHHPSPFNSSTIEPSIDLGIIYLVTNSLFYFFQLPFFLFQYSSHQMCHRVVCHDCGKFTWEGKLYSFPSLIVDLLAPLPSFLFHWQLNIYATLVTTCNKKNQQPKFY